MIPKIIHYCWFGDSPMPNDQKKFVEGWHKLLPEYEFKLWNESNFDINIVPFTQQVAKAKKWGFIVDYIRAYAIYNYGGIYIDTDVELLKSLDDLLTSNICFSGFENESLGKYYIAPGLIFAGEKKSVIAKKLMDYYSDYNFIGKDGKLSMLTSPLIISNILLEHGLKLDNTYQELGEFTAYPNDYFCPMDKDKKIHITQNTYSIHYYAASWSTAWMKIKTKIKKIINNTKIGKTLYTTFLIIKYREKHK